MERILVRKLITRGQVDAIFRNVRFHDTLFRLSFVDGSCIKEELIDYVIKRIRGIRVTDLSIEHPEETIGCFYIFLYKLLEEAPSDHALDHVHLEGFYMSAIFTKSLCLWIQPGYHSLRSFHLVNVGLSDDDATSIIRYLKSAKNLKILDFSRNQLSNSPKELLAKHCGTISRLELLDLSGNSIPHSLSLDIIREFKGKSLLISNARISPTFGLISFLTNSLHTNVVYLDVSRLFLFHVSVAELVAFLKQRPELAPVARSMASNKRNFIEFAASSVKRAKELSHLLV